MARIRRTRPGSPLLPGLLVLALAAACAGSEPVEPEAPAAPAEPVEIALESVAAGLEVPWGVDVAPDGRLFVTERPGRIRVVDQSGLRPEIWAEIGVVSPDYRTEGGLMGIALAPDFEATGHVYVVATFEEGGRLINRVLRFTDRDGRGTDRTVVIDDLPSVRAEPGAEQALHTHLGGGIGFGPDGMLYVTTGDATRPALSQDPTSLAGKLLRYRPDGTVPDDNPAPGSPVYAQGLRNPQGLAWHPETGDPFVTDHGPSELSWEKDYGGWFGDELNAIVRGGDYGWPQVVGTAGAADFIDPLVEWSPSIGPAGLAVYSGGRADWQGDLMVASLRGQTLWRVEIERDATHPSGWRALNRERLLEGRVGRIRLVAMGRDGHLYIASSNRDSRGRPTEGDDHLYRLVPATPAPGRTP